MFVARALVVAIQAQVDQGPPKSPPPPLASAQQVLEQLKVRPDTLKPPRAVAAPQAAPAMQPPAAAPAGPTEVMIHRRHAQTHLISTEAS